MPCGNKEGGSKASNVPEEDLHQVLPGTRTFPAVLLQELSQESSKGAALQ